jgi:PST family polysaccharide transporter
MNLQQKAVKGFVWSAIQSWGRQAITFIVFFVLARLLAPETFGLVALASVFLSFVQLFLDQGFTEALVQRQQLDPEHLDTAFWTNLGISFLLTVFGIGTAGLIAELLNQPELTSIIRWLSFSFLFAALSGVQESIFRRNLAFKALAVRSLVAVIAGGLIGVAMALMGYGVWSLVGQQLVNSFVQVLVLWWTSDWRPRLKVSSKHFRELFSFGINVLGIRVLDFFNRRTDDLLIGYFLGPVALGYYTIAYKILLMMTQLLTSVTDQVAIPTFSRLQQEPEQMRHAFYKVTQLTSLISFPAYFGLVALAPELVRVVFGPQWLPSIPVMQILAFIGILHSVYWFNATVIVAMGKPFWKLILNFVNATASVVSFPLVVRWGIVAIAAAYVIFSYLLAPLELWMVNRLICLNLTTYFRQYVAPLTASLTMVGAIWVVKYFCSSLISVYALLAICILLGSAVYVTMILLIAPSLARQVLNLVNSVVSIGVMSNKN